ncbi:MAG: DUF1902 domain-containing protein [Lachnospiraceae bacterium]|nr:DUF1902 domain-containing protein [Lachnospiraceae bacterium]
MNYNVNMAWDEKSEVWIATSDDIPGLTLESGSFDALIERVHFVVPELLELNGQNPTFPLPLVFHSECKINLVA